VTSRLGTGISESFFTENIEMGFYLNIFLKGHDHESVIFEKNHKGTF
jgi:hypothetical protein